MKEIKASELKAGMRVYVTDTGNRWASEIAAEDAQPRTGRYAKPGEWITFYVDCWGHRCPQVFPNGMAYLPETGDGPAPVTWHDRHVDSGVI